MKVVLLSGGSGKRLWPLSNQTRSKQFLKLLPAGDGTYESMIQRICRQICNILPKTDILITTGDEQRSAISSQLDMSDKLERGNIQFVTEPERRDTFPAILLSTAYLASEGANPDETVIVIPVDPFTGDDYFRKLIDLDELIQTSRFNLTLLGIKPTYPSEKYGYILPEHQTEKDVYTVKQFCEKPDLRRATELVDMGAFWNAGVFAFRLNYALDILQERLGTVSFSEARARYGNLEKISFDYAVTEREPNIGMLVYGGEWKDLGTWNTLTEEMGCDSIGSAIMGEGSEHTYIINELSVPIVALGMKNTVIAASPDGILVSDLEKSAYMKPYVDRLEGRPMYEERVWGTYKVLDFNHYENGLCSLTKHLMVLAGRALSYQSHELRDEIWTIVDGTADLLIDGHIRNVRPGDVAYITKGQKHSIRAVTNLRLIEVQLGTELTESDIVRYEWKW